MDLKNYLADKVCRSEDRREIKIMSMLDGEWAKAVGAEFKKPYYRDLYNFVRDEYATHVYILRQMTYLMPCILRHLTR